MRFFQDFSLSAVTAGFVAMLVGFTSSVAIIFQAAQAFQATPAQITSWVWALGLGAGLCTLLPSLLVRMPVMVAWSTPGLAVLATAGLDRGFNMAQAVGAFLVCAVLMTLAGLTRWFERAMNRIPMEIASALLAGVLARFGLQAFTAAQTALPLVLLMLSSYLLARRFVPRYAVVVTLAAGIAWVLLRGQMAWPAVHLELARPVFTAPQFSISAAISLAIPLFVVTMASQNLPGVAVIRATGYDLPVSHLITLTGLATLVLAPFGAHALNLSAITAAICMGPETHADRSKRYAAAVGYGLFYVLIGLFGAIITSLLMAFPKELVAAIAGLALLGTIGNGLATALREEPHREAALITFLVTLSGVVLTGVGSAFWGVVAGSLALLVQQYGLFARRPELTFISHICTTFAPFFSKIMQLLFIADPLECFNIYKDTTFAMMREAQRRGHTLAVCEPQHLMWQRGSRVAAHVRDIVLTGHATDWFDAQPLRHAALADFDAVLMRKDPPFDSEYFYATHLLEQAERDGARVFNKPCALRDHPEKLAIMEFPQFIGPTLVTRDPKDILQFHAEHQDIILKPLDGMGGMGIFRVGPDGLNLGSITETLNRHGTQSVMVQKFLPEITEGDKRVLIIGGQPVPFCLARIPQGSEVRGNLAAGGKGVARPLSARDREIGEALGTILHARGLLLAGVDVIGDCVTEINVTSPTCFQEIFDQTGCDVASLFMEALEAAMTERSPG